MAHMYDYLVDFKDLDVAFIAADRNPSPKKPEKLSRRLSRLPNQEPTRRLSRTRPNSPLRNPISKLSFSVAYPGSWKRLQKMIGPNLCDGRRILATEYDGKRAKIATADGNLIDTMCVDRRNHETENESGEFLVVCCEGNSGFYEIGFMFTILQAGFSALGWNPPGFCCSTGNPGPSQIQLGIDSVMQYAISVLKFPETKIVIFGYSIGGYPATWAATQYPKIRGVILDACFDELLPLVMTHLNQKMKGLMGSIIKEEYNLNISSLLCQYPGPVTIIRRSRDEIVGVNRETGYIHHTNLLLRQFLAMRYPQIVNKDTFPVLDDWLNLYDSTQDMLLNQFVIKCPKCPNLLRSSLRERFMLTERYFPVDVGAKWDLNTREHVTLYLAEKHLKTCPGTHVSVLPPAFVKLPWDAFHDGQR